MTPLLSPFWMFDAFVVEVVDRERLGDEGRDEDCSVDAGSNCLFPSILGVWSGVVCMYHLFPALADLLDGR